LRDDGHRIERTFHFSNFRAALDFVRDVGDLAETEGHHPDVSFGWGYATVSLRTKKIAEFCIVCESVRRFEVWNSRN